MEQETITRPRGQRKNEYRAQYCLILDIESAEWAKAQPDGISARLRKLLNADYKRSTKKGPQPDANS